MKIYPKQPIVSQSTNIKHNDLALCFTDLSNQTYSARINKKSNISYDYCEELYPFEEFESDDYMFFDKDNNVIDADIIQQKDNKYLYIPEDSVTFQPELFTVAALIKKNLTYRTDKTYKLKVVCSDETLSNDLVSIFGNAPDLGICPPNIIVNNKSNIPATLYNNSYIDKDFLIAKTVDGLMLDDGDNYLNVADIISNHCNIWITVSSSFDGIKDLADTLEYDENITQEEKEKLIEALNYNANINTSMLYKNKTYNIKSRYCFSNKNVSSYYPVSDYTYLDYFDNPEKLPFLILENQNNGYIIISHESFFDNISDNINLFYEVLMFIYLKSYMLTARKTSWITDNKVNYYLNKNNVLNKRHDTINLTKLIENDYCDIDDYTLLNFDISNPNVIFTYLDADNNLNFSKLKNTDPTKDTEQISLYTSSHNIIQFKNQVIRKIESNTSITLYTEDNDNYYIKISPVKSSKLKLDYEYETLLKINDYYKNYYIIVFDSHIRLVEKDDIGLYPDSIIIAEIISKIKNSLNLIDVRVLGGGLPLDEEDGFSIMDISNPRGTPIRKGGYSIIVLPSKLKQYDKYIQDEVLKHKTSEVYIAVKYE